MSVLEFTDKWRELLELSDLDPDSRFVREHANPNLSSYLYGDITKHVPDELPIDPHRIYAVGTFKDEHPNYETLQEELHRTNSQLEVVSVRHVGDIGEQCYMPANLFGVGENALVKGRCVLREQLQGDMPGIQNGEILIRPHLEIDMCWEKFSQEKIYCSIINSEDIQKRLSVPAAMIYMPWIDDTFAYDSSMTKEMHSLESGLHFYGMIHDLGPERPLAFVRRLANTWGIPLISAESQADFDGLAKKILEAKNSEGIAKKVVLE